VSEAGASARVADVNRRKVLVTGCGRSGTRYTTFVLRRLGLDVPHERLGRDGIASWTMAVEDDARPFGPPSGTCAFEHVFHQVRHPLDVVRSASTFGPDSWEFICRHTRCRLDQPVLLRSALYWLDWTAHADRSATWSYRVEAVADVFEELCERLGVDCDRRVLAAVPSDVNTRSRGRALHLADELGERLRVGVPAVVRRRLGSREQGYERLTWSDLDALDAPLSHSIRRRAADYGYAVDV
jgi:hypothetical protein